MRVPALVGGDRRMLPALVALAVLALAGFAAVDSIRPPAARPASAPSGEFSAARAFTHVQAMATVPHPAGSAANDAVRERILATLRGLGLTPEVQDTVSVEGGSLSASAGGIGLARVRNVVALLPGTASTGRIFLVAHYDSAQIAPGANDDAAGTAAILEVARALTAGPRLRNDVVLVLTDAEEACLCGAKAFVDQHPLARGGGVVLNLEARGSSGPAIMFETSARNRALIDAYATTPDPVGTSFAVEIYRLLPNDTDFTAFRDADFAGLNTAYIDGSAVYHAPTDVPSAMNRDSLQHHGSNALALSRTLGTTDVRALTASQDATYFPAPGLLIRYPGTLVLPLAALAVVAVLALAWQARRRGLTTTGRLAAGSALTLVPLLLAPAVAQLYWPALITVRPGYGALPIDPYRPQWYRLAVLALVALVVLSWFALLRRRLGPATLAITALAWLSVTGVALAVFVPGGSYLAALPALAGALTGLVAVVTKGWWQPLAVTAGAAIATLVLLPAIVMLLPALGMPLAGAGAFLATLLALALLPVADLLHPAAAGQRGVEALKARRRGAVPSLAALTALLATTATGMAIDRFDATHPSPTHLMYALDATKGTARWLSAEPRVQKWTSQFVTGEPRRVDDELPSFGPTPIRTGPAPAAPLPAPDLKLTADTRANGTRTMRLKLIPQRPARLLTLHTDAQVTAATVAGRPLPVDHPTAPWGFIFHAPPPEGIDIQLTVRTGTAPTQFQALDGSDGLTTLPGFHPRPPTVGVVGSHTSELTAVTRTYAL